MNSILHRRDLLKGSALLSISAAASAVGLGVGRGFLHAAVENAGPDRGPQLKISLNAYSFAKLLNDHALGRGKGMTLIEFAEFCSKHGFDGMDPTGYYFPGYRDRKLPDDKFVLELKQRAADLGLGISGTGVGNNFTVADKAARDRDVQWIKQWVEVAAKLGAPVLRVFADTQMRGKTWETASNGATRDQVEEWIAADLRECAEHAAKFSVIIGVQNHGDFLKTAGDLLALVDRVHSPACGVIVDTGYFKAPDPYAEMAAAAPRAVNWQIKQSPFGVEKQAEAPTDLKKLLRIIRASGYKGYLPIETLSPRGSRDYDPYTLVPKFLAELRQAIAETA